MKNKFDFVGNCSLFLEGWRLYKERNFNLSRRWINLAKTFQNIIFLKIRQTFLFKRGKHAPLLFNLSKSFSAIRLNSLASKNPGIPRDVSPFLRISVRISSRPRINPSRWIIRGTDAVRERRNRVELPINRVGISAGVGFHQHERPSSSTPRLTEASAFGVLANRIIRIREVSRMTRHNVNARKFRSRRDFRIL